MKGYIPLTGIVLFCTLNSFTGKLISGNFQANHQIDEKIHEDNDTFKVSAYSDKFVVISFWSSRSKASRTENKTIVRLHSEYASKKDITFVGISLDTDSSYWKSALAEDKLNWGHQYCDFRKWDSPVVRKYAISTLPVSVVLNKKGEVIANGLSSKALEDYVASLYK